MLRRKFLQACIALLALTGACTARTEWPAGGGLGCLSNAECRDACIFEVCSPLSTTGGSCDDADDCRRGHGCELEVCVPVSDACDGAEINPGLLYSSGDGSPGNPHLLCTAPQLVYLATATGDWDKHFRLTADIDLTGSLFEPIGNGTPGFTGTLDGNSRTIRGLSYATDTSAVPVGMFSTTERAAIHDLTLDQVVIDAPAATRVGALAGEMVETTVSNVTISNVTVTGFERVGGLVGECSWCFFEDLNVSAQVTGSSHVGGVLGGTWYSGVVNVQADIAVEGTTEYTGGLVGYGLQKSDFQNIDVSGSVVGVQQVGGLFGVSDANQIYRTSFVGTVSGNSAVGGLVGAHYSYFANIRSSWVDAIVTGNNSVAGILGDAGAQMVLSDSFSRGTVTVAGTSPQGLGGIIGQRFSGGGTFERTFSVVDIVGDADYVGGICGEVRSGGDETFRDNFFAGTVAGDSATDSVSFGFGGGSGAGTYGTNTYWTGSTCTNASGSCNTALMTAESTLASLQSGGAGPLNAWDFTRVWQANLGGFPTLRRQSLDTPQVAVICPVSATEGLRFDCTMTVTDADANEVQFVRYTDATTCSWLTREPRTQNPVPRGLPAVGDAGSCDISLYVTDGTNASDVLTFSVTVTPQ